MGNVHRLAVDHIGLSVGDLETAADFYGRAFGYERELEFEVGPERIPGLMLRHADDVRLELFERPGSVAGIQAATPIEALAVRGYGHLALAAAAVDPVFDAAVAAGARPVVEPRDIPERGIRLAFVADPEGNLIELVEQLG